MAPKPIIQYLLLYLEMLKKVFGDNLVSMCLYGSVARGSFDEGSDIDVLLVVSNLPPEIDLRIARVTDLKMEIKKTEIYMMLKSRRLPTLISDVILTPEEVSSHPPILLDIVEDGLILYDKDFFLSRELSLLKNRLNELGARRIKGKHGFYWILKPDLKLGDVVRI